VIEESAFDGLFRRYYTELYIFAKRLVLTDADSQDIVSEAYEDVWNNMARLEVDTVRAFLYKNVRNKCIDHLRRLATRRNYVQLMSHITQEYDMADRLTELHERECIINEVLDSLPDYTRQVFTACYVDHKKYIEVAEEMGISTSTVKKYIVRALRLIAEKRHKKN
jgi:RNA polymerase sigma-70 factor (ECF subfamily)